MHNSFAFLTHGEVGTRVEVVNPLNRRWIRNRALQMEVRGKKSSLFMEISYFILIIHCLNCPHKMPCVLFKLQIIASNIIRWKLEFTFLISRKLINNEWGCYLFATIPQMETKKRLCIPHLFLLTLLKLASGEIQECGEAT